MKFNKIIRMMTLAAVAFSLTACSDNDTPTTPLETTQGEPEGISYNSLTFEWEKVKDATQYGYELYDNLDKLIVRSVTDLNTVTVGDLQPATEYTLKVWSYAALGSDHSTSEPFVIKATTLSLKAIGRPTLSCTAQNGKYVVSWKSVSNATEYAYILSDAAGTTVQTGTISSRSLSFGNLEIGDYTIAVKALSSKGGYESEGEYSTLTFTVEDLVVWKVEGTYRSELLGQSWPATIVCYGDNNYSIKGWYGVDGYDLDFMVDTLTDPEDTFSLTGDYDYDNSSYSYVVPTGRTDLPEVYVYQWWNYSLFSGNKAGGSVKVNVYNDKTGKYVDDLFTWSNSDLGSPADDFVGTWNVTMSGLTAITDNWEFEEFNISKTVEITKVDAITIAMPALNFSNVTMNVVIDMAAGTLTAEPMTVEEWFTFAGSQSDTSPVVGTINEDGSFEFIGWNAWFEGFPYLDSTVAKYTR